MIFSASRRTDIPSYYAEWLCNRLASGEVCVRHDSRRVVRYLFSREAVDGLILWTKNPLPLLERAAFLREWPCVFQFTLTGYDRDVEPAIPDKRILLNAFRLLAGLFGRERMIWRYDPLLFNETYTVSRHVVLFESLAQRLREHTQTCVISFMDRYPKLRLKLAALEIREDLALYRELACRLAEIAARYGITLKLCAEAVDVPGVAHAGCVSRELVESVAGCRLELRPSRQRALCRCVSSVDIGVYGTCGNGCVYCYANTDTVPLGRGSSLHNPASPLLVGNVAYDDEITEQHCVSLKSRQGFLL